MALNDTGFVIKPRLSYTPVFTSLRCVSRAISRINCSLCLRCGLYKCKGKGMSTTIRNDNTTDVIKILLSDSLAEKTEDVVWLLRNEPNNSESSSKAINLLRDAAEVNIHFYFTEPAKQINIGAFGVKLITMGVNTILKLISSVGHKIVKRLSAEQLGEIADFVEKHLLTPNPRSNN